MGEPLLEGERVNERLQRRARRARRARHVDRAAARRVEIIGGADARAHLAAGIVDDDDRRRKPRPKAASTASSAKALELGLQPRVDRELEHMRVRVGGDRLLGGVRRRASGAVCASSGIGSRLAGLRLLRADDAARDGAVEHARAGARAPRPGSVPAGALRAIAAAPPAAPPRRSSACAAPCRNRRARRRARLRDCRRTAPASDSGRARPPWRRGRSICQARAICRSLADRLRSSRGSISRATCIVSVEPPETTWPRVDKLARRRAPSRANRRRDARRSARPHRRSAWRDSADRPRRRRVGSRQRPSGRVKARSSRPSRSTTIVEPSARGGKVERAEALHIAVPRRWHRRGPRRRPARRRWRRGGVRENAACPHPGPLPQAGEGTGRARPFSRLREKVARSAG